MTPADSLEVDLAGTVERDLTFWSATKSGETYQKPWKRFVDLNISLGHVIARGGLTLSDRVGEHLVMVCMYSK